MKIDPRFAQLRFTKENFSNEFSLYIPHAPLCSSLSLKNSEGCRCVVAFHLARRKRVLGFYGQAVLAKIMLSQIEVLRDGLAGRTCTRAMTVKERTWEKAIFF